MQGWPASGNEIPQEVRSYWTFRNHLVAIHGILMKVLGMTLNYIQQWRT